MASCEEHLNENEREDLKSIQTYEDFKRTIATIENSIAQASGSTLLQKLGPLLNPLYDFVALLTASISSRLAPTAVVWGLMSLLIRVRLRSRSHQSFDLTSTGSAQNRNSITKNDRVAAGVGT